MLAEVRQKATGRGSGIVVERDATWVYEIRDLKLIYMSLYFDRGRADADARQREAQAAD